MAINVTQITRIAGLFNSIAWMDRASAREVLPLARLRWRYVVDGDDLSSRHWACDTPTAF